jgi:UPF0042 nucleotide-binding protein
MNVPTLPPLARPSVVVVTGLSGAGKSTTLHALEDVGFFCVDNLPTMLAPEAVRACEDGGMMRVALGMDVRVRSFLAHVGTVLAKLEGDKQRDVCLLFLDASDETLVRRFSETRRPHPLNAKFEDWGERGGVLAVLDGVLMERERLAPLRARASRVIDTTALSVHELRRLILAQFGPSADGAPRMIVRLVSFGFKYGAPVDADLVLDVRFLDNPYFIPELKALRGTDPACFDYVMGLAETKGFLEHTHALLDFVLPKYEREGKAYLTVGIGCTGGRHRSVAVAEAIARHLAAESGSPVVVAHRDVARGESKPADLSGPISVQHLEMPPKSASSRPPPLPSPLTSPFQAPAMPPRPATQRKEEP